MNPNPELLSLAAASTYTASSLSTVKRLIARGAFPALKIGRKTVVRRADVDAWISTLPAKSQGEVTSHG